MLIFFLFYFSIFRFFCFFYYFCFNLEIFTFQISFSAFFCSYFTLLLYYIIFVVAQKTSNKFISFIVQLYFVVTGIMCCFFSTFQLHKRIYARNNVSILLRFLIRLDNGMAFFLLKFSIFIFISHFLPLSIFTFHCLCRFYLIKNRTHIHMFVYTFPPYSFCLSVCARCNDLIC